LRHALSQVANPQCVLFLVRPMPMLHLHRHLHRHLYRHLYRPASRSHRPKAHKTRPEQLSAKHLRNVVRVCRRAARHSIRCFLRMRRFLRDPIPSRSLLLRSFAPNCKNSPLARGLSSIRLLPRSVYVARIRTVASLATVTIRDDIGVNR
jgi:hypothetical protein